MEKIHFKPGRHGYDEFCCWECDIVFFDCPTVKVSICPECNKPVDNEWADSPHKLD